MNHLTGPRNKKPDRERLGTCLRCHYGIYTGDPHLRGRGIWLGLLHTNCASTQTGAAR